METIASISALAVFFASLARWREGDVGLKLCFFVLFLMLSLRYDLGNDYQAYRDGFFEINRIAEVDYSNLDMHFEVGWVFICRLFESFGFFAMIAALAAFNCFSYWFFVSRNVPKSYWWLAVFIYTFDPSLMLIHASAMRQSVAIAILLFAVEFLKKKNTIGYLVVVWIASLFHSSALVFLPLVGLCFFEFRVSRTLAIVAYGVVCSLFFAGSQIQSVLQNLIGQYFERYTVYDEALELGSGLGVIFNLAFLALVLWSSIGKKAGNRIIFLLAILSYIFIPLTLLLLFFSRLLMYFQPWLIAALCISVQDIRWATPRRLVISVFVAYTLYIYYGFFSSELYGPYFSLYKTIFSAPEFY